MFVSLLVFSWLWSEEAETPTSVVRVTAGGHMFSSWEDEGGADCEWWNGTYKFSPILCSPLAIARTSTSIATQAIARATRCALAGTTDCVLSVEIGLDLPSAFVYDQADASIIMMIAPRLLEEVENTTMRKVRMEDPMGMHPNALFEYYDRVRVEFMRGGTRTLETVTLDGVASYCVQSLRNAIVNDCWSQLD